MAFEALKFHWKMLYPTLPKQDKICPVHSHHKQNLLFEGECGSCLPEFCSMFTIYDRVKGNLKVKLSPVGNG